MSHILLNKKLFIIALSMTLVSCATNSQSRLAVMGIAAPMGAGIGALSAPKKERPEFHALTWGAVALASAAFFGHYYFNDDKEINRLRSEIKYLKEPKLEMVTKSKGYFKNPPSKGKEVIRWKVYKIDQWISVGEDIKYHRDLMIKREKAPAKNEGSVKDKTKNEIKND